MFNDSGIFNYLRQREQGNANLERKLNLEQDLIVNNDLKYEKIGSVSSNSNSKAFLISMSIDKCFFAVAKSDNKIGIYCALSGALIYQLSGAAHTIYTISWHPYLRNIIGCSDLSGSVFVWDLYQTDNRNYEFQYFKRWSWRPFLSMTYSIDFHPYSPVMTIARDREIRFVNWVTGHHISVWRFYSEFSWVPWISWSFVGTSLLVSVGNPQNNCMLNSIIETISEENFNFSPVKSGCSHNDHNNLCHHCDTCAKISQLAQTPPTFNEYQVNCVDLIRFVLSRPTEWYSQLFICVDCRNRFHQWANSIQIHGKYSKPTTDDSTFSTDDVDSSVVTIIESPLAPELVWDALQIMDENQLVAIDDRLSKFLIPHNNEEMRKECRQLLRCVAMFERECLRQSICWCCIQQLHRWIMDKPDFPRYLYEEMLIVRQMVIDRCRHYDIHLFDPPAAEDLTEKQIEDNQEDDEQETVSTPDSYVTSSISINTKSSTENLPILDNIVNDDNIIYDVHCVPRSSTSPTSSTSSHIHHKSASKDDDQPETSNESNNDDGNYHQNSSFNLNYEPVQKRFSPSFEDNSDSFQDVKDKDESDEDKRLRYLKVTLKMLQLYVSEPSRLGDIIDIMLHNDFTRTSVTCYPYLNVSKIESYCIRRWTLQPLGETPQKILPRLEGTDNSNVIVPSLVFSSTGLSSTSIRISNCGRYIAVLVPPLSFQKLHSLSNQFYHNVSVDSPSISPDSKTRKRPHSLAFGSFPKKPHTTQETKDSNLILNYATSPTVGASGPVIGIYSVEPESNCGQLLHYFHSPYDSISLDFSPLGNLLLVGLSQFHYHSSWLFSNILPHAVQSLNIQPIQFNQNSLIGAILDLSGQRDNSDKTKDIDESDFTAPIIIKSNQDRNRQRSDEINSVNSKYGNIISCPTRMSVVRYLKENIDPDPNINPSFNIPNENNAAESVDDNSGVTNCAVWNTSGGILYSRARGGLFSVNYVGCTS